MNHLIFLVMGHVYVYIHTCVGRGKVVAQVGMIHTLTQCKSEPRPFTTTVHACMHARKLEIVPDRMTIVSFLMVAELIFGAGRKTRV